MKATITLVFLTLTLSSCSLWREYKWNQADKVWKAPTDKEDSAYYYSEIANKNDFVARFKVGTPIAEIEQFEADLKKIFPNYKIESCNCDPSLRRYTDLELTEIRKSGELAAKPDGAGAGEVIDFKAVKYLMPTFITMLDSTRRDTPNTVGGKPAPYDEKLTSYVNSYPTQIQSSPVYRIGVLDTGYDFANLTGNSAYQSTISKSTPTAGSCDQRNMINPSELVANDDDPTHHGSIVTSLLISELQNVPAQVYPIKVLDRNGKGNLHHLLCALASNEKFTAYNVSLGFYADTVSFPREILSQYMNKSEAWFFVAAGNKLNGAPASLEPSNTNLSTRKYKFYPACLRDVPKMIAVTTIKPATGTTPPVVSPNQNYSSEFVALGVLSNSQDCAITIRSVGVGGKGSSFATPIALGRTIASWNTGRTSTNPPAPEIPDDNTTIFSSPYTSFTQTERDLPSDQIREKRIIKN